MKKVKFSGFALVAIMLLISCSGDSITEKTIHAKNVSISGDGSEYIKVVDGDYILKVVGDKVVIAIKLELTKKYDGTKEAEMSNLTFVPLDKTGAAVSDIGKDFSPATESDWDKVKELLKGNVGKQITISFEWDNLSKKDVQQRIMKETENFEITRADITGAEKTSTENNVVIPEGSKPATPKDSKPAMTECDKFIKDYDAFADSYVKIVKKYKNNPTDPSILVEYTEAIANAAKMQGKAKNCSDVKYAPQLASIAVKMAAASN